MTILQQSKYKKKKKIDPYQPNETRTKPKPVDNNISSHENKKVLRPFYHKKYF